MAQPRPSNPIAAIVSPSSANLTEIVTSPPAKPAPPLPGGLRRAYARTHSYAERVLGLEQPGDQPVDVVGERVEVEARAVRCGHTEPRHQRLRAVVAGPDGHSLPVEDLRDVVRVHALELE